ncbi:MAG: UvrD-helicase domain-containing protein [Anaerolineaceae bacterium]|nr:UvrD-helicase domain-containing protein [Anaerolineaceae bacterium]
MTPQASLKVTRLLDKLFKLWADWEDNKSYYIHTLLPELINKPNKDFPEEKAIAEALRSAATPQELEHIEEIAENFAIQRKNLLAISHQLDGFFGKLDFNGAEAYISDFSESSYLNLYADRKRGTINRCLFDIEKDLDHFQFDKADRIITIVKPYLTEVELNELDQKITAHRANYGQKIETEIDGLFADFKFDEAKALYAQTHQPFSAQKYSELEAAARQRKAAEEHEAFVQQQKAIIYGLLEKFDFLKADEHYALISKDYPKSEYLVLVKRFKDRQAWEIFLPTLKTHLEAYRFKTADELFSSFNQMNYPEYMALKSGYVVSYVNSAYGKNINAEKGLVLSSTKPNTLVSARAGSGKTTVLACKASMLMDCEQIDPDQILIMAFNRKAANEIRHRIRGQYKKINFDNARTFHSLAHQLVKPTEELLFDEKDEVSTQKMSQFVQDMVKTRIDNPAFIQKMYQFFRKETLEMKNAGLFQNKEDYFNFRRNLLYVGLDGRRVKSDGEKYIADYLFEHGHNYAYEKFWKWGKEIYRPDFSIYYDQMDFVIEHWGIDENDSQRQVPEHWSQSWDEYHLQMEAKREYWEEKEVTLIETSVADLKFGRERFETILDNKLRIAGIYQPKLPEEELHKRFTTDHIITRITRLFTQFIQRAKKKALNAQDVRNLVKGYQTDDPREAAFVDLASRVYMAYERALIEGNKIDFDDLLLRAIGKIYATKGECKIALGPRKNRHVRMKDLKWILIDEYQDFSELFFRLVSAIRQFNPQVKLLCVGDDWQAINGFAGSDLKFFTGFTEWVKGANIEYLLTNYRSQSNIVEAGNAFMEGLGRPSKSLPDKPGGQIRTTYVDDVWLELRNDLSFSDQKKGDERFCFNQVESKTGTDSLLASKYLKLCYQIITSPLNFGKKVGILSRSNWVDRIRLIDFKRQLLRACNTPDSNIVENASELIDVQTVHKYKGLEADIIILLNVCNGSFPMLHPDNGLFGLFGRTIQDVYDEERRLFYVALTRAKSRLYLITEKQNPSSFLKAIKTNRPSSIPETAIRRWSKSNLNNMLDDDEIPF